MSVPVLLLSTAPLLKDDIGRVRILSMHLRGPGPLQPKHHIESRLGIDATTWESWIGLPAMAPYAAPGVIKCTWCKRMLPGDTALPRPRTQ